MEKLTLEQLMAAVGCPQYPERWNDIYEEAMEEYDKNGCPLASWDFYENLNQKYGCFEEYGYVYQAAVEQLQNEELLQRFLVILTMALNDKEHKKEDLKEFKRPRTPEGKEPVAYEMATALALCTQFEGAAANLRKRGVDEKYIKDSFLYAVNGTRNYIWRHDGAYGYDLLSWAQKYIDGTLFPINRLEIELFATFGGRTIVYQNEVGELMPLAHELAVHKSGIGLGSKHYEDEAGSWECFVEEDEEHWIGYPFLENGLVAKEKIKLRKDEWKEVVRRGDPAVSVHIPPTGKLTDELVEATLKETREFIAKYYPEFKYKAFGCTSWMMSTQLDDLLGGGNIVKFSQRFRRITRKAKGEDVFGFVFHKPDMNFEIKDLRENTTLEKKLKELYMNGGALYEMYGFFL